MSADYEQTYRELIELQQRLDVHIHQNLYEFAAWINLIRPLSPLRGLEIGTYMLGSAECTVGSVPSIKRLVTIDVKNWRGPAELGRRLIRLGGRVLYREGDSKSPEMVEAVRQLVDGVLDFAFIDGEHSYNQVKAEFSLYEPMLRGGGLIGFHDVLSEPSWNDDRTELVSIVPGMLRFWQELLQTYPDRCSEIHVPPGPWGNYRIGVYVKP